tara:strand:- start:5380 stop:6195 length:816 start_codon:yes stop_codon:yes gene_type:complete
MRNYFAGSAWLSPSLIKNHLIAWIDSKEIDIRSKYFNKDSNILIDSGAFSAFTQGKKIDIDEYVEFIKSFTLKWQDKVNSIYFINLDEIGNSKASWKNQEYLDLKGIKTIPVIHQWGYEEKNLIRAIENYDYFAFGGMVGRKRKADTVPWLNKCYKTIGKYYNKNKKIPKIHLLGVASPKILYRYPCFSCDSTAYMSIYRYGESAFLKLSTLPKGGFKKHKTKYKYEKKYNYNKEEDVKLLVKVLNYEIRHYQKQEKEITEFWKKKGIIYE